MISITLGERRLDNIPLSVLIATQELMLLYCVRLRGVVEKLRAGEFLKCFFGEYCKGPGF